MIERAEARRAVPLRTQLDVAKRQLAELMRAKGFEVERLELDHDPALGLRPIDPVTGQHIPHQHDPKALIWRSREAHKRKTFGTGATTRGADVGEIAHVRRLDKKEAEFRARLLAKDRGEDRPRTGRIKSRPRRKASPQRSATRPIVRKSESPQP